MHYVKLLHFSGQGMHYAAQWPVYTFTVWSNLRQRMYLLLTKSSLLRLQSTVKSFIHKPKLGFFAGTKSILRSGAHYSKTRLKWCKLWENFSFVSILSWRCLLFHDTRSTQSMSRTLCVSVIKLSLHRGS